MMTIVKVIVILLIIIGFIIMFMKHDERSAPRDAFGQIAHDAAYLHRYQSYDHYPYSYHLSKVAEIAKKYWSFYGDEPKLHEALWMAAWFHDTIEDVPSYTYNDVFQYARKFFGENEPIYPRMVAEIVYACTTEKGKNRKERSNDKYYQGIRDTGYAPFIKACDRLANMTYASHVQSKMDKTYRKELPDFLQKIENPDNPIPPELKKELCQFLEA